MSGKNTIFENKKINKSNFYKKTKNYFIYMTKDVDDKFISKKEPCLQKSSFKYFLDIMTMMPLDLYI